MTYAATGSTVLQERSRTGTNGELPVRSTAHAEYIHPFKLVPQVTQQEFDTQFKSLHEQRIKRMNALFTLTAITLMEDGAPSAETDQWLAEMRQNIRDLDGKIPLFEEERVCVMGITGMYLSSETSLRQTDEADVYRHRVYRAEQTANNARMSNSPYGMAHTDIQYAVDRLAQEPSAQEATEIVASAMNMNPHSPEFTFAKAEALFNYATTMQPSAQKQALLLEAMSYADETFANAAGDNHFLRGSALHIVARALHDTSEIPHSYSPFTVRDAQLAKQARNFSVALLQQATREFQATDTVNNLEPVAPVDESLPWAPKVTTRKDYEDARYFQGKYHNEVLHSGIYIAKTPEIQKFIARQTAIRFGHEIVDLSAQDQEEYISAA